MAPVCDPFVPLRFGWCSTAMQPRCHTRCSVHSTPGIFVDVGIILLSLPLIIVILFLLLRAHSGACIVAIGIVVGIYGAFIAGQVEQARQATQSAGGRVSTGGIILPVPGTRCSQLASPYLLSLQTTFTVLGPRRHL